MSESFSGGCLCGAVKYTCEGEAMFAGHCQCTVCRKLSGTGHSSFFAVPADSLHLEGKTGFHEYGADSGNTVRRHFCSGCGSPIYAENSGMPELRMLCASNLDNPELFQPGLVVYTKSAVSWDHIGSDLHSFPAMPDMSKL